MWAVPGLSVPKHRIGSHRKPQGAEAAAAAAILTYFEDSPAAGRVEWDLEWTRASPLDTDARGMHQRPEGDRIGDEKPEEPREWPRPALFPDHAVECIPRQDCAGNAACRLSVRVCWARAVAEGVWLRAWVARLAEAVERARVAGAGRRARREPPAVGDAARDAAAVGTVAPATSWPPAARAPSCVRAFMAALRSLSRLVVRRLSRKGVEARSSRSPRPGRWMRQAVVCPDIIQEEEGINTC